MSKKEEFDEIIDKEDYPECSEECEDLEEDILEEEEMLKKHRLMQFLQQRSGNTSATLNQSQSIPQETALEQNIASTPISSSNEDDFMDYSKTMEVKNEPKYSSMSSNTLPAQRQGSDLPQPDFLDPMQGRGFEQSHSMEPQKLGAQHHEWEKEDDKKYQDIELEKRDY